MYETWIQAETLLSTGKVDLGLAKIHEEIPRADVAATIVEILHQPEINRVILEVTGGATPIPEAVMAMKR